MKQFLKAIIFLGALLFFSTSNLFAEISLISPCEGVWSNKQALIIQTGGKGDYFYSLNGSDPAAFGFAYDGPILIDLKGDVSLRVVYIENGVKKEDKTVKYTVNQDLASATKYRDFVSSFSDSGILNYTSGTKIEIPQGLVYSLGKSLQADNFLPAQDLMLSSENVLSSYIPCVVKNEASNQQWRFIIRTIPSFAGIFSRRDVPFYITDWDTITFTNDNYIYKIDSEYWELPKSSKKIDRSISHMISWQSIDYQTGNPIEFFVLSKRPEIKTKTGDNGEKIIYIEGDSSYSIGLKNQNPEDYQELYTGFSVDTFYGDAIEGVLNLDVFTNSLYQGSLSIDYSIDKCPPAKPVVQSDSTAFYSRKNVSIKISTEKNYELYYGISDPYIISDVSLPYTPESSIFKDIKPQRFIKAEKNQVSMNLKTQNEGAVFFKILSYAKKGDYESKIAEFTVIIDQYNYYYDINYKGDDSDGTAKAPYNDFEQCIKAANATRNSCIHLKGLVEVPGKELFLYSNTTFETAPDTVLNFNNGSSIVVKSASLEIKDCQLKMSSNNSSKNKTVIPVFKLENSVLDLINCNGNLSFGKNGTLIDSYASTINMNNSVLYITASSYASCVSSVKSRVNIKNSILNVNADTAVILSLNEGDINLVNNSFKVSGSMGRVAELFGVGGIADSNKFQTELSRHQNEVYPIYADKKSTYKDVGNVGNGY